MEKRPYNAIQRNYTNFLKRILKWIEGDGGFSLDKKNKKMHYYVNQEGYGIFIPKKLQEENKGLMIITHNDLSIGLLEFTDFPFSPKPIFVYRRHKFTETIKAIIDIHKYGIDIDRKKSNRHKEKERTFSGIIYQSASTFCRKGFGI